MLTVRSYKCRLCDSPAAICRRGRVICLFNSLSIFVVAAIGLRRYTPTMSISAFDSRIFRNLFGTEEIRRIFTDEAYAQYLIHTEAALARAESMVGLIPRDAGPAITAALDTVKLEYSQTPRNHLDDTDAICLASRGYHKRPRLWDTPFFR